MNLEFHLLEFQMPAYTILSFQKEFSRLSEVSIFIVFVLLLPIELISYLPIIHPIKHIQKIVYISFLMEAKQIQFHVDQRICLQ